MKRILFALLIMSTNLFAEASIVIQVEENIQDIAQKAADILLKEVQKSEKSTKNLAVILPTGSTPIAFYEEVVLLFQQGKINFSKVHFFHLDEYVGLAKDHPNSYNYYLHKNLFELITPGLNLSKLKLWGLKEVTKKHCYSQKLRKRYNETLHEFKLALQLACQDNPNFLDAFDEVVAQFKKDNSLFNQMSAEFFNDKHMPSLHSLRAHIEQDIALSNFCANPDHIHTMDGLATDLENETYQYHKHLKSYLNDATCRVICFAGIGAKPAHVAFNEFAQEDLFLKSSVSEIDKNRMALSTQARVVPLCQSTREINARFFAHDSTQVPLHALTLGFEEIMACDRIVILAQGYSKKNALYKTFMSQANYQVPASLLTKFYAGQLNFIVDEQAFGLGEEHSLFSMQTLGQLGEKHPTLYCQYPRGQQMSVWNVPKTNQPCLLDKGYKIANPQVHLATLPQKQTVLWVKDHKMHYSLWQELKEKKNKIHVTSKQNIEDLWILIEKYQPDVIILPYSYEVIKNFSALKNKVVTHFSQKPILGIFYDIGPQMNNTFFPMDREEHKAKIALLSRFHHSQVSRTRFDLIAEEMNQTPSALSPFNETYSFFHLHSEKKKLKLTPFEHHTYIERQKRSFKKQVNHPTFKFSSNDLAIFIAPHPDDAEISAGGLIQFLGSENIKTHVLNATSGHNAVIEKSKALTHPYLPEDILRQIKCEKSPFIESKALKARIRECESLGALYQLNQNVHLQNLRLPFYDMPERKRSKNDQAIIDDAIERAVTQKHERIFFFLPYPEDSQPTHRDVYKLFMEKIAHICKNRPDQHIILGLYPTAWTGEWNLYDFSYNQGSKLAALCGAELLVGSGKKPPKVESLGGIFANRYHLFYFN